MDDYGEQQLRTCYVALHPYLRGVTGDYFDDCNEEDTSAHGEDEDLAKKLWDLSEKMVKANEQNSKESISKT